MSETRAARTAYERRTADAVSKLSDHLATSHRVTPGALEHQTLQTLKRAHDAAHTGRRPPR